VEEEILKGRETEQWMWRVMTLEKKLTHLFLRSPLKRKVLAAPEEWKTR
jgi:hypothetical protein